MQGSMHYVVFIAAAFQIDLFVVYLLQVKDYDPSIPQTDLAHFSRPGSAYAMRSQSLRGDINPRKVHVPIYPWPGRFSYDLHKCVSKVF